MEIYTISYKAHNQGVQSDSVNCHALCVPHKDAPACYAVDAGVMALSDYDS